MYVGCNSNLVIEWKPVYVFLMSRGNIVGIAIGYGLDYWGVGIRVPVG
jgi:hypothetical protein